jgi:hypothetical protein
LTTRICALGALLILAIAGPARADSGGATYAPTPTTTAATTAVIADDGRTALVPETAPKRVKRAIRAANRITRKPYRYGGGHGSFKDSAYDCSGAVSYVLHAARVLRRPRASTGFMSYGHKGAGRWISVYANSGHAYMVVAGLRFDTSGSGEEGPRWRPEPRSNRNYTVRHPPNL